MTTDWKAMAIELATILHDLAIVPILWPRDWDGDELDRSEVVLNAYREAMNAEGQNTTP